MPDEPYIIFFDGHCRFCRASAQMIRRVLGGPHTRLIDSTNPAAMRDYPQVDPAAAREQMFVLAPDRTLGGGYDGVVLLAGALAGLQPMVPLLRWPPVRRIGQSVYRWVARHRGCAGGACSIR